MILWILGAIVACFLYLGINGELAGIFFGSIQWLLNSPWPVGLAILLIYILLMGYIKFKKK